MGNTSFEKANKKLLGSFSSGVKIETPVGGERVREDAVAPEISPRPETEPAVEAPAEQPRTIGRPRTEDSLKDPVTISFRVEKDYRQKIKIVSAEKGLTIRDIIIAAIDEYLEKLES